MATQSSDTRLSKFISLILRHEPEVIGIQLDGHGWAKVDDMLAGMCAAGRSIDRETLERIVRTDQKGRYSFDEDQTHIRANQGHSIPIDLELTPVMPPDTLYHGTATRFLNSIRQEGICPMSRQYVHFSTDVETAVKVGKRHGKPVVLALDAGQMYRDGIELYVSANHIWLTKYVDWKYVKDVISV